MINSFVSYSLVKYNIPKANKKFSANFGPLKEIFDSGYFSEIENTWATSPLQECSKQCGKFDKLGAQFES